MITLDKVKSRAALSNAKVPELDRLMAALIHETNAEIERLKLRVVTLEKK